MSRIVIKIGSSLLVDPAGEVRRDWLATLVTDVAMRRARGDEIIIVSSGAIALGARKLGLAKGGRASLEDAQAAAATGQIALSQCWADLLDGHGITAAQMLVTLDDLEDRRRYLNASATLDRLIGDEALRRETGAKVRDWSRGRFTRENYVDALEALIDDVIGARPYGAVSAHLGRELTSLGLGANDPAVARIGQVLQDLFSPEKA